MSNISDEGKDPAAELPPVTAQAASPPSQPAAAASPAPMVVVQTQGGRFWKLLAWFGWGAFFLCAVTLLGMQTSKEKYYDQTGGLQEKFHSLAEDAKSKVAIIDISGVISGGEGSFVKKQIDLVRDDDSVKAVVLRVNSPGGTITGSDYIYHHLCELRDERKLPIVVSMGGIAASGGYYVSMAVGDQEDSIFAERTTTTGSIGVIVPHYDLSGLLESYDIQDDSITSGPHKQLFSMTRPPTAEQREIMQEYVDDAFEEFLAVIKEGRPAFRENDTALRELASGTIFNADDAEANGLVDEIGYLEDAIERALFLADLNAEQTRVVRYEKPVSLMSTLAGAQARSPEQEMAMFMEMTTPRAWYVFTALPPLVSSWELSGR